MIRRAALVLAACTLTLPGLVGCRRSTEPSAPEHGEPIRVDERALWRGVPMVSPVRLPTSEDGRVRIVVFLSIPEGVMLGGDSFDTIRYERDVTAERVEFLAPPGADVDALPDGTWRALDVRGFSSEGGESEFHVFRPSSAGSEGGTWLGARWPRTSAEGEARGGDMLASLAISGRIHGSKELAARPAFASKLREMNRCIACHVPQRADARTEGEHALVRRGTDGSGFFQVASVFRNEQPLETYRPRDTNAGDPRVEILRQGEGLPRARYDLARGLREGEAHASQVCAAREYVFAHMGDALRASVQAAMEECRGGGSRPGSLLPEPGRTAKAPRTRG